MSVVLLPAIAELPRDSTFGTTSSSVETFEMNLLPKSAQSLPGSTTMASFEGVFHMVAN